MKNVKKTFNAMIREENEDMLYDIGIVWFLLNSLPQNSYSGNKYKVSDMDIDTYYSYLKLRLEVVLSDNGSNIALDSLLGKYGNKKHELIKNLELKAEDIEFSKGKKFISGFKKVEVKKEDFKKILDSVVGSDDYFVYLDSPYFLTYISSIYPLILNWLVTGVFDFFISCTHCFIFTSKRKILYLG